MNIVKGKQQDLQQYCYIFAPSTQQVLILKSGTEISGCKIEVVKYVLSVWLLEAGGERTLLLGEVRSNSIVLSAAAEVVCI